LVKTARGERINVELQREPGSGFKERVVYYTARSLCDQLHRGDDYAIIRRTISIVITDFIWITGSPEYANYFTLYDHNTCCEFSDIMSICTLELPKVASDASDLLSAWLGFMKAQTYEELDEVAKRDPVIRKAVAMLVELSEDEATRMLEEQAEKARRDEVARRMYAECVAKEEGLAEGEAKGEAKAVRDIARNMKNAGATPEFIAQTTGLSMQEIAQLY